MPHMDKPAFVFRLFTLTFFCIGAFTGKAQTKTVIDLNNYRFQYGFSLKALVELGFTKQKPNPVIRIVLAGGMGSNFINNSIYPTVNAEFQFYNGGIGSSNKSPRFKPSLDAIIALTVTAGIKNHFTQKFGHTLEDRNIPLYYFADFTRPPLQNPFSSSLSLGTNLIFTPDNGKSNQRVGFINVHVENFQFCYYNDGGAPIRGIYLGDRADRYYTGGGVFSYNFPHHLAINSLELSYHKYTGYSKSAFEASNKMYLDYMSYHDTAQMDYNKSLWSFSIYNSEHGLGVHYKWYNNVRFDLQHRIHYAIFNAFHMVPYDEYHSLGIFKSFSQTNIGIR